MSRRRQPKRKSKPILNNEIADFEEDLAIGELPDIHKRRIRGLKLRKKYLEYK